MKKILVLGAGRSSSALITYLLQQATACDWFITVGDISLENALKKLGSTERGKAVIFDIHRTEQSREVIAAADIVISLLPPELHVLVALRCLEMGKHFVTASYVSDEIKAFDKDARTKGLLFLNECGLDPGLDHLSAMKVIDRIRTEGGYITSFESFTGGLISSETDPGNPWRYKFTWNPRNVVMAGQSTARYRYNGRNKYIPYQQLFKRITPVHVPGYGNYEGYANRDSLKYIDTYQLKDVATLLRGTLRHQGFCAAWNILAQLGCCEDTYSMEHVSEMTHAGFMDAFLPPLPGKGIRDKLIHHFALEPSARELGMLEWSGLFDETPIALSSGTPARILEHILNKKWALNKDDKDQIVMWHRFRYTTGGREKEIQASLVATGNNSEDTAMARTVGLPLAIATRLILQEKIQARGVIVPTTQEFYQPILDELASYQVIFRETETY